MSAARALALSPAARLVDAWRVEVEAIDAYKIPCPGASWREWPKVRAYMLEFLDVWGEAAVDLGWADIELFGVHRAAAMYRVDSTGVLVLVHPYKVEAIDGGTILFTNGLVGRRMTNPGESIPLWDFVRGRR